MQHHPSPARRVYYDWDESTSPDVKLSAAFERTQPGVELSDFEDEPTREWLIPVLAALVAGFFVGRWWMGRKSKDGATVVAGDDSSGFDELGVN